MSGNDIISEHPFENVILTLSETLKSIVPQNLTNANVINDLNNSAKITNSIMNLQNKNTESLAIVKIKFHFIIMYVL